MHKREYELVGPRKEMHETNSQEICLSLTLKTDDQVHDCGNYNKREPRICHGIAPVL